MNEYKITQALVDEWDKKHKLGLTFGMGHRKDRTPIDAFITEYEAFNGPEAGRLRMQDTYKVAYYLLDGPNRLGQILILSGTHLVLVRHTHNARPLAAYVGQILVTKGFPDDV